MSEFVLDASALLALLDDEPGGGQVRSVLRGAWISTVNLSEVAVVLLRTRMHIDEAKSILDGLPFVRVPFDDDLAFRAAALYRPTRALGLSFGDRACLALAQSRQAIAVTAERAWSRLKLGIDVRVIR